MSLPEEVVIIDAAGDMHKGRLSTQSKMMIEAATPEKPVSEYERQTKIFAEKTGKPDITIQAYSHMKSEGEHGEVYWFLSGEDTVIMIDCRDEDSDE